MTLASTRACRRASAGPQAGREEPSDPFRHLLWRIVRRSGSGAAARWKAGLGTVIAEFDWFLITEMLIVEGLLTEREIDDRRRVGEALSLWLSDVTRDSAYRRRRGISAP